MTAPPATRSWVAPEVHRADDAGVTARLTVRPDDAYLAGHYPGAPVLPGMLLVEAVDRSVRAWAARRGAPAPVLRELVSARFRAPVRPGDVVDWTCTVTAGPDGTLDVRARCATDRGPVATVALRHGGPPDPTPTGPAPAPTGPAPAVDLDVLLPHREPVLFVDAVVEHRPGSHVVATRAVTGREAWFTAEPVAAGWPAPLVVESLFQAGGTLLALEPDAAPPGTLLLVGAASRVAVLAPVPVGARLAHRVELVRRLPDAVVLRGTTWDRGTPVLHADQVVIALRAPQEVPR